VTHSGAFRSENVGTSNRNGGENPPHRKSKVSYSMIIIVGLVGPKGMAIAGPDGQQVNIPALRLYAMERRRVVCRAPYWIGVGNIGMCGRKIRHALVRVLTQSGGSPPGSLQSTLPRKSSKLQYKWNRTENRHRWIGRVDQGERVRGPQGTRQKSSRNFGIRLAS
jgi:hypothetical protein